MSIIAKTALIWVLHNDTDGKAVVRPALVKVWLAGCVGNLALDEFGNPSFRLARILSECPCHHERELFSPECAAVRSNSLAHNDIRTCIAQGVCPPLRVL